MTLGALPDGRANAPDANDDACYSEQVQYNPERFLTPALMQTANKHVSRVIFAPVFGGAYSGPTTLFNLSHKIEITKRVAYSSPEITG